mmetsp:Transcript_54000/g.128337  ORF Transcript_54000/g.128337 Transcript_54000/m.128337 type:complete len:83 (+) Transcript_54000:1023-1271(+)
MAKVMSPKRNNQNDQKTIDLLHAHIKVLQEQAQAETIKALNFNIKRVEKKKADLMAAADANIAVHQASLQSARSHRQFLDSP